MKKKQPKKTRQEINEKSRLLKKKRKHKGLASGSRANPPKEDQSKEKRAQKDPRIGSKKAIPLTVDAATKQPKQAKIKPISPELELEQLENSPYLDELMDLVENGQKLTTKQQNDFEQMLDRIEALMKQLGYTQEENESADTNEDDEEPIKEDIMHLLRR